MKKNKKILFAFCAASFCAVAVIAVSSSKSSINEKTPISATEQSYELMLDSSKAVTEEQVTAGGATYYTSSGNPVKFDFHDAAISEGRFVQLDNVGSYVALNSASKIKGLTSLTVVSTMKKGAYAVYAGSDESHTELLKTHAHGGDDWEDTTTEFVFAAPVNYVKIVNIGQDRVADGCGATSIVYLGSLKFKYSCEEATYEEILEVKSEDMLYGMEMLYDAWWDYDKSEIDYACTDVAADTSGYSMHVTGGADDAGWPTVILGFAKTYDFTDCGLEFNAKFVECYKWVSITLVDAATESLTEQIGFDAKNYNSWNKISIDASELATKIAEGKDLTAVAGFKLCFNFDDKPGQGVIKNVWLDEMHPTEDVSTFGKNMEGIKVDAGDSRATIVKDYTEHFGPSSVSSAKYVFASNTTADAIGNTDVAVSFSPVEQYGENNPVLNNGTLEFDVKPSLEILNCTTAEYKHQLTLKIIQPDWTDSGAQWIDIVPAGSWGYIAPKANDGWFHFSIDLGGHPSYSSLTSPTIRIKIGFFGVTTTNRATATINIDNMTYTAA